MTNALPANCAMTVGSDVAEVRTESPTVDLRAAREQKGLSLDRIAADTKIPRSRLEALERRDLREFPSGFYARAHARAYAAAVGLSSDDVLAALADRLPSDESLQQIALVTRGSVEGPKRLAGRERPRRTLLLLLMGVTCVWALGPRVSSAIADHGQQRGKPRARATAQIDARPAAAEEHAAQRPLAPSRTTVSAPETFVRTPAHRRIERKQRSQTVRRSSSRGAAPMMVVNTTPRQSSDAAPAPEPLVARTLVSPMAIDFPGHAGAHLSDAGAEQPHTAVGRAVRMLGRGLRKAVLRP